jgi:hypothetical protein
MVKWYHCNNDILEEGVWGVAGGKGGGDFFLKRKKEDIILNLPLKNQDSFL